MQIPFSKNKMQLYQFPIFDIQHVSSIPIIAYSNNI